MDDLEEFSYKAVPLTVTTDYIFHRGTITAQIEPKSITTVTPGTDLFTSTAHGLVSTDPVRFGTVEGTFPTPLNKDTVYYVIADGLTANDFKVSATLGGSALDITADGVYDDLLVWKADTGFDDPEQGEPTFFPGIGLTFNNIAYIEGKLPESYSTDGEQPDWADFRIIGTGRRLMDYDNTGAELGILANDPEGNSNIALEIADNMLQGLQVATSRFDWASWFDLKTDCDVLVWQRVDREDGAANGIVGRYYQDEAFSVLHTTTQDSTIDISGTTIPPVVGLDTNGFSVLWEGDVKAEFSELYTISCVYDNEVKVYLDNELICSGSTVGTATGTKTLVADQFYRLRVEFKQYAGTPGNPFTCQLKWQSTSQALEIIPNDRLYLLDVEVRRYECHTAFPTPTEASEVHERLMERAPGWDWTDDDGIVKFLAPDRSVSYSFSFDKIDDDSLANFVQGTFKKQRRPLSERKNFLFFRFRDVLQFGFPFQYTQAEREELRDLTSGEPSNDPYSDLGVMTRSLAERMAENQIILKTDPEFVNSISGKRESSKIRKNQLIRIYFYDSDENFVEDQIFLVTFHGWGSADGKNDFSLLPIAQPFYTDEPVV